MPTTNQDSSSPDSELTLGAVTPRHGFEATVAATWDGVLWGCRDLWDGYALGCPVLESTPLQEVDWATLFAYMHRRFGPPHSGGDPYKDLGAAWILRTPDPQLFVQVCPSISGAGFSFTPLLSVPEAAKLRNIEELEVPEERITGIQEAFRTTLLDLLRPVGVRDQWINALGELDLGDADAALAPYKVRYHASAGYCVPVGMFGGKEWPVLCGIIRELGAGDFALGRQTAIARLQLPVLSELALAPWPVRRMVLLGYASHSAIAADLSLERGDLLRFEEERAALARRPLPGFVDEMSEEPLRAAVKFLDRLGIQNHGLARTARQLRKQRACEEAWTELVAIASNDFPDASLPPSPWTLGIRLPAELKERLQKLGREDLVTWVDRVVARTEGLQAMEQIVCHLHRQASHQHPPSDSAKSSDHASIGPSSFVTPT